MKSNDQTNIPKANLLGTGASSHIGWAPSIFNFGLGVDYFNWSQVTDVAKIGNLNLGGTQLGYFLNGGFHIGSYTVLGKYFLHSVYTFENQSRAGNQLSLEGIDTSFSFELLYHISHSIFWGASYGNITYDNYKEASIGGDLTQQQKTSLTSIGLKLGLIF